MNEEMRGLMCGTSPGNPYDVDDTGSEEEDSNSRQPNLSHPDSTNPRPRLSSPSSSRVTCNVCTTHHSPPIPMCCDSCNNVLQREQYQGKTWTCTAAGCHGIDIGYVNSLDVGRCGLCGAKKLDSP
jgi:hypothetical protein